MSIQKTPKTFFDLVKLALPEDVHPHELTRLAPEKWWREKPYLASAYALRKCPRFNWEAYLAHNEDVKQSGMDPCLHFLKHGIFEGRKLISWHELKEPEKPGRPLVSIVVINYNNAHLLEKCIGSVVNQTLRDIEIIIVDDCSTDESLDIIRGFAANDERIKVLVNPENSLTLITRKRGVEAATGRYLMFLDSDDYLVGNACEIAVKEIEKGYDAVKFGVNIVNLQSVPQDIIQDCDNYCNKGENREYFYYEITNAIFRDYTTSWNLWSLIYLREMSLAAFKELGENRFTGPDDLLATMAIMRRARNMLKINDRLICYNFGPGITASTNKKKIFKYAPAICTTTRYIYDYALKHCPNIAPLHLYLDLCEHVSKRFLPVALEQEAPVHFRNLIKTLGLMYVLRVLMYNHSHELDDVASLFPPVESKQPPRSIGIYISPSKRYDLLDVAQIVGALLASRNYEITLFVEGEGEKASFASLACNVYYLPEWRDNHNFPEYLEMLAQSVTASGIDIMLHAACHSSSLWEAALLQSKDIPLIFIYPFDSPPLGSDLHSSAASSYEPALRCAQAVICASSPGTAYWTSRGVNAVHLPPPARAKANNRAIGNTFHLGVLAHYLDCTGDIDQCVLILQAAKRSFPWITLCMIGELKNCHLKSYLIDKLREYDLFSNIYLTGEIEEHDQYLTRCQLLLAVAKTGPGPFEMTLAQAYGLPVIGYGTHRRTSHETSVVLTPFGNFGVAGEKIVALLQDEEKLRHLSGIASEGAKQDLFQSFSSSLLDILINKSSGDSHGTEIAVSI